MPSSDSTLIRIRRLTGQRLELLVDEDLHYELKESLGVSDLLPGGSPEKLRRMIAIANDFARSHKDAIAEGDMLGQERDKCSFIGELRSWDPTY